MNTYKSIKAEKEEEKNTFKTNKLSTFLASFRYINDEQIFSETPSRNS